MDQTNCTYVAIDMAKDSLEVCTGTASFSLANDEKGWHQLLRKTRHLEGAHYVFEATGGYERGLLRWLQRHELPVSVVSAWRVRQFARSDGLRAKNDALDARLILRFARQKRPRLTPVPTPAQRTLADLLDRRDHIVGHLRMEKTRRQNSDPIIHPYIDQMIAALQLQLEAVQAHITRIVDADAHLRGACAKLQSITGVGAVMAWTLLAYIPEIGQLNRNELAAMVGVAPFDNDSATINKPRHIQGGRAKVRKCLYMCATTAARHNPVISTYVQRLTASGKPYKVAIVAAMRKLLIHMLATLRNPQFELA